MLRAASQRRRNVIIDQVRSVRFVVCAAGNTILGLLKLRTFKDRELVNTYPVQPNT